MSIQEVHLQQIQQCGYIWRVSSGAKRVISISVHCLFALIEAAEYKENHKNIRDTLDHTFKNIPLYTERQKKLITSSRRRPLKSTLSILMIFAHK